MALAMDQIKPNKEDGDVIVCASTPVKTQKLCSYYHIFSKSDF